MPNTPGSTQHDCSITPPYVLELFLATRAFSDTKKKNPIFVILNRERSGSEKEVWVLWSPPHSRDGPVQALGLLTLFTLT